MEEQDFTNREISGMFKVITDGNDRIEEQTKKTNGSVAEINKWRERVNGGALVASIFMSVIVIPMFSWCIYTMLHIDDMISSGIKDALSVYETP